MIISINFRVLFCSIVVCCAVLGTSIVTAAPAWHYHTFHDWDRACSTLPLYRTVRTMVRVKPTGFMWHEMETALTECARVMREQLSHADQWVRHQMPDERFFNLNTSYYRPYAQKVVVPVGATVAFHGDLHGDIHSLLAYLKELQHKGYLDTQDPFKINDPRFYLIFLGDYVDRGIYGAEVIYTLLRLKIANPTQVILLRGNHEDGPLNARYGFAQELKAKFNLTTEYALLYQWYHLLPVVLYCGSGTGTQYYFQCCHGGMEIGYMPTMLLSLPGSVGFEYIARLKRRTYAQQIAPYVMHYPLRDSDAHSITAMGFLWSDFCLSDAAVLSYNPARGWQYGCRLTQDILARSSTATHVLVGVMRAHQHDNSLNGMMGIILDQRYPTSMGVGKLWRSKNTTGKDALWPGIVCTFNVAPDTPQGVSPQAGFTFDTYALLTTGNQYPQDWQFNVCRITPKRSNILTVVSGYFKR